MVIKYKEVKKGTEPTETYHEQVQLPGCLIRIPSKTNITPTWKPVKGQVKPGTQKPLQSNQNCRNTPKKPVPKPLRMLDLLLWNLETNLNRNQMSFHINSRKTSLVTPPTAPRIERCSNTNQYHSTQVEQKSSKNQNCRKAKAHKLMADQVTTMYQPSTIWVTVDKEKFS